MCSLNNECFINFYSIIFNWDVKWLELQKMKENVEFVLGIMDIDLALRKTILMHLIKIALLKKRQNMKMDESKSHVSYNHVEVHIGYYSWKYSKSDSAKIFLDGNAQNLKILMQLKPERWILWLLLSMMAMAPSWAYLRTIYIALTFKAFLVDVWSFPDS